ncbi:MAG: carboxymuconolactone decarboxylase family protein [Burkholderiaceae bacterium]|nr:carboxymuconolactone decarboxylase family protein [Desulfobacterales bacterium]MDP3138961.1 carboxymuconolactone decarboxylase family protein [Burkholderiaceae bacterium]
MSTIAEIRRKGLAVLRAYAGKAYIDRRKASDNSFNRELRELSEVCMGTIWTRKQLDRATRSLVTVGMLTALNRSHELTIHLEAALNNGCTPAQIKEVILQSVIYCGFPAAGEASRIAEEIFRKRGIDL